MNPLSRRHFLQRAAATTLAFSALGKLAACGDASSGTDPLDGFAGFGDLVPDPAGVMDLPEGFTYRVLSEWQDTMDDGFLQPLASDGMAAFPGPDGTTVLVRNHELYTIPEATGPFGEGNRLLSAVDPARVYDYGFGTPSLGGTTTLVYDTRAQRVVRQFLSLVGTTRNCAGGPTPWGSWISCEEFVVQPNDAHEKAHGFAFEVPARADGGLVLPVPLVAMGRFNHEAVAVHPESGCLYQTEDRRDGLLYRFVPTEPGNLAAGGRLQALVARDRAALDARNWEGPTVAVGERLAVRWVDLEQPESPNDDLRRQGTSRGAATFARGEGVSTGSDGIYVACTSGGLRQPDLLDGAGQVWRYVPSPVEGRPGEDAEPGTLELLLEPNDRAVIDQCDNVVVTPWGDLLLCEDGDGDLDYVVGLRPNGQTYRMARNVLDQSEFAGVTFSPDGTTMFVNYQWSGKTFAITGPWPGRRA